MRCLVVLLGWLGFVELGLYPTPMLQMHAYRDLRGRSEKRTW
jgi:hypothetical protein